MRYPQGIEVVGPPNAATEQVLTPEALGFVAALARRFSVTRAILLEKRDERQARLSAGELLDFLPETEHVRTSHWTVAPTTTDLQRRHVEITGPDELQL